MAYPERFVWMWLIPALIGFWIWAFRRRHQALERVADAAVLPHLTGAVDGGRRRLKAVLLTLGVACLVVALVGPQWGFEWEEVKRRGVDLVIAVDVSKSMLAEDVKPNRLARAKLAIRDLLMKLKGERVGILAFAGTSFLQCPLTTDYGAFLLALEELSPDTVPRGSTDLAQAIRYSLTAFAVSRPELRVLIVVTDGEHHAGDAVAAAREVAATGVKIFTVGMGRPEGELIPITDAEGRQTFLKDREGRTVKSRLNETLLEQIALAAEGSYVRNTATSLWLDVLYQEHIAKLSPQEAWESPMQKQPQLRFQWVLAAGLLLLSLELLLSERKRGVAGPSAGGGMTHVALWAIGLVGLLVAPRLMHAAAPETAEASWPVAVDERQLERLQRVLERRPNDPDVNYNVGTLRYQQGTYDEAVEPLRRSRLTATDGSLKRWAAYNLGNTYYRQARGREETEPQQAIQHYEQALEAYQEAIRRDPADRDAQYNYELTTRRLKALKDRQAQATQAPSALPQPSQEQRAEGSPAPRGERQQSAEAESDTESERTERREALRDAEDGAQTPRAPDGTDQAQISMEQATWILDSALREERGALSETWRGSSREEPVERDW